MEKREKYNLKKNNLASTPLHGAQKPGLLGKVVVIHLYVPPCRRRRGGCQKRSA